MKIVARELAAINGYDPYEKLNEEPPVWSHENFLNEAQAILQSLRAAGYVVTKQTKENEG